MKYAAVIALAGCISVPQSRQPACSSNDDCNRGAGEVCQEGLCWGNPPAGPFAASLAPSADRPDLVPSEIQNLLIPDHGWMGDLVLDASVTVSGRVEAYCAAAPCDTTTIAAKITVTRPSLFKGGPGFSASVVSKAGVARGADSFSIQVPRSRPDDPPYVLSVLPDGRGEAPPADGSTAAAEVAPPARMTLLAMDDVEKTIALGSEASQTISGLLTDIANHPLKNYRIAAVGQLATDGPIQEVSTVAYTSNGQYVLTLSDGIVGNVELVARSYDTTAINPTLRLGGIAPATSNHPLSQPAGLGNPVAVTIPIEGVAIGGEVTPTVGALVRVTASSTAVANMYAHTELRIETTTGNDGVAHLTLLDGAAFAGDYRLDVVPQASSNLGVIYDRPIALAGTAPVRLPPRIALKGIAVDANGSRLASVSVTARPALRFTWSLDTATQKFLAEIPASTAITPESGEFLVYVDPSVASVWGSYDLDFEPPMTSGSPAWTQSDVVIPRVPDQTSVPLGSVTIPDAAFIHGRLTDSGGTPVVGGELRVFVPQTNLSLCSEVAHAPDSCVIPAQLAGHGTSDDTGTVRLTLPRP